MGTLNKYRATGGSWVGYAGGGSAPPSLVQPDATNTGLSGSTSNYAGDLIVTTAGTTVQNLTLGSGRIIVRAPNVKVVNCWPQGNGQHTAANDNQGLIDVQSPLAIGTDISHCKLVPAPANVSVGWTGILGANFVARYCLVQDTVDGFNCNQAAGNVILEYNYVPSLSYLSPDANHPDGHSHNDCYQIQGGGYHRVYGNSFQCVQGPKSNTTSPYNPALTGQAVAITPNVNAVHDVAVLYNWLGGGAQAITYIPGPKGTGAGLTVNNNVFSRNSHFGPVKVDPSVTVVGFPSGSAVDSSNANVFTDGSPINIIRG